MSASGTRAISALLVWARLGVELAWARSHSNVAPGRFRIAREMWAHRKAAGLTFLLFAAAVPVVLYLLRPVLPRFSYSGSPIEILRGAGVLWLIAALLLIVLNQALFPRARLGFATLLRAGAFLILGVTGLAAQSGISLVDAASEAQLSGPRLQPLLVGKGREPLNEPRVRSIQQRLEEDGLAQPASSVGERAVFGRHAHAQVRAFIPTGEPDGAQPDCSAGGSPRAFAMMAVSPDEPFLRALDWARVGPGAGSGRISAPPLEAGADGGSLYVTRSLFSERGGFGLDAQAALPRWLCVSLLNDGTYVPYAIVAVIEDLPGYDYYDFRIVMHIDAGATVAAGRPATQDDALTYSLMSVWIEPEARADTLTFLRERADAREINTEVGFSRLEEAIGAARTARNLAIGFAVVVALLAVTVTIVFVLQSVDHSRREIAVALAFGAGVRDIVVFVLALLFVPLAIAVLAGIVMVLYPFAWVLGSLAGALGFEPSAIPPAYLLFGEVVAYGAGLAIIVIVATVFLRILAGGPIAEQLQEAG